MKKCMLDLFSGLGGASQAMLDRGWDVVRVDNNPAFKPDVVADVLTWIPPFELGSFDLVWASPPCTYFSRYIQRGCFPNEPVPSLDLYLASKRIIQMLQPKFWVIENVRGAVSFFTGRYISYGSFFLWGNLPELACDRSKFGFVKSGVTSGHKKRASDRGRIPYALSCAVADLIERQEFLPGLLLPCSMAISF